jgi:hypothetical protein
MTCILSRRHSGLDKNLLPYDFERRLKVFALGFVTNLTGNHPYFKHFSLSRSSFSCFILLISSLVFLLINCPLVGKTQPSLTSGV